MKAESKKTATKPRAKMSFDLDDSPRNVGKTAPVVAITVAEARKTVATRLPPDLYKQAKARAALEGISIQAIIETALPKKDRKPLKLKR